MEPQLTHFFALAQDKRCDQDGSATGELLLFSIAFFFYSFPAALIVQFKNKEKISAFPQINSISTSKIGLSRNLEVRRLPQKEKIKFRRKKPGRVHFSVLIYGD